MYHGIDRNSGIFSPEVSDELNTSFSNIQEDIVNLDVPALDYKYPIKTINIQKGDSRLSIENRTVTIGRELLLSLSIRIDTPITMMPGESIHVGTLSISCPYRVYIPVVFGLKNYRLVLYQQDLYLTTSTPDTRAFWKLETGDYDVVYSVVI